MITFRYLHMRRAGGHAVIEWIHRSIKDPLWFYNSLSVRSKQQRPFWLRINSLTADPVYTTFSLEDPNRGRSNPLQAVPFKHIVDGHEVRWLPRPDFTITILRDFYNIAASRFKAEEKSNVIGRFWRDGDDQVWLDQARWAITNPLFGEKHVTVLYNRWLEDAKYRAAIAEHLGFTPEPYDCTKVAKYGGGSSFTGTTSALDTRALQNRWIAYAPQIKRYVTPEIVQLNKELFNMEPEL